MSALTLAGSTAWFADICKYILTLSAVLTTCHVPTVVEWLSGVPPGLSVPMRGGRGSFALNTVGLGVPVVGRAIWFDSC